MSFDPSTFTQPGHFTPCMEELNLSCVPYLREQKFVLAFEYDADGTPRQCSQCFPLPLPPPGHETEEGWTKKVIGMWMPGETENGQRFMRYLPMLENLWNESGFYQKETWMGDCSLFHLLQSSMTKIGFPGKGCYAVSGEQRVNSREKNTYDGIAKIIVHENPYDRNCPFYEKRAAMVFRKQIALID